MNRQEVYLRLRNKITIPPSKKVILLGEVAQLIAPIPLERSLREMPVQSIDRNQGNLYVIDAIHLIRKIRENYPDLIPHLVGSEETLIEMKEDSKKRFPFVRFMIVWILLFFGSGLAIMNFHTDVSMGEVHERIYYLLTGKVNHHPYLLQIPYSIGIGIGMLLFFNHFFRKKFNEEPSPLELEVYLYQENVEKYAKAFENRENRKENDGSPT